jgi:uncharacterized protein YhaN
LENEQLKLKLQMQTANSENSMGQELLNAVKILSAKIERLEKSNKEVLEKINASQTKLVTGFQQPLPTLGPHLQKINPETFELVKVYESVSELMKENSDIKRPSINKAVVENTIYHGFRWLLVDRELDANKIVKIQPTKITKIQHNGYIAKLNKEGKKVRDFKGGGDHHGNWLKAVRSRKKEDLNADILEGHLSSALCHLGNISVRLGEQVEIGEIGGRLKNLPASAVTGEAFERVLKHLSDNNLGRETKLSMGRHLTIDSVNEVFVGAGSSEANPHLFREYRKGFEILRV